MEEREQIIIEIISDLSGMDIEDIKMDASLRNDLGIDSLDLIEIVMVIEQRFDIMISDELINSCRTVKELINISI